MIMIPREYFKRYKRSMGEFMSDPGEILNGHIADIEIFGEEFDVEIKLWRLPLKGELQRVIGLRGPRSPTHRP